MDGWTIHPEPVNGHEWALSTARAYSPVHSVKATVPEMTSDQRLDTPFFEVPSSPYPVAVLFMHRWNFDATQACDDGGVLEYSEDNGRTWKAVPRVQLILNALMELFLVEFIIRLLVARHGAAVLIGRVL